MRAMRMSSVVSVVTVLALLVPSAMALSPLSEVEMASISAGDLTPLQNARCLEPWAGPTTCKPDMGMGCESVDFYECVLEDADGNPVPLVPNAHYGSLSVWCTMDELIPPQPGYTWHCTPLNAFGQNSATRYEWRKCGAFLNQECAVGCQPCAEWHVWRQPPCAGAPDLTVWWYDAVCDHREPEAPLRSLGDLLPSS